MEDFIRARSEEQKEKCMDDIKSAADRLFSREPYHSITLSKIADELGCSRTKVYQYASTKEEIFLEVCRDRLDSYFSGMMAAFPEGCGYSPEVVAEVWSGILNAHRDYLRYSNLLFSMIETNVSVDRLASFKANYYRSLSEVSSRLASVLGIGKDDAESLFYDVYFHAIGLDGYLNYNPLVEEALAKLGMDVEKPEFREDMRRFILMCARARI